MRGVAIARKVRRFSYSAVLSLIVFAWSTAPDSAGAVRNADNKSINFGIGLVQDDTAEIADRLFVQLLVGGVTTPE